MPRRAVELTELGDRLRADPLYRAIFDINTAVKLLIDPGDGRIVDANPAALELYGWPLETLRTMTISDINTLTPDEVRTEMEAARTLSRRYFRFFTSAMKALPERCLMNPAASSRTIERRTESLSLPPIQNANRPALSVPSSTTITEWDW